MSINTPCREFDIYTCQFVSRGLFFGDEGLPLPYKVLAKVMDDDYKERYSGRIVYKELFEEIQINKTTRKWF